MPARHRRHQSSSLPSAAARTTPALSAPPMERLSAGEARGKSLTIPSDSRVRRLAPHGEQFVSISSGHTHTCALREDGTAACWGDSFHGQTSPPEGERFVSIVSPGEYTCGLRADGAILCWGSYYPLERGTTAWQQETFALIGAGTDSSHACGLRENGSILCWGADDFGQASPPLGEQFIAISAGSRHTCALRRDGSPVCWGTNNGPSRGEWLGQAWPPEGERFTAISSGSFFTCALRADGTPVCWGKGYDTPEPKRTTYSSIRDEVFVAIAAGFEHT